jgi:hypothetical protein
MILVAAYYGENNDRNPKCEKRAYDLPSVHGLTECLAMGSCVRSGVQGLNKLTDTNSCLA